MSEVENQEVETKAEKPVVEIIRGRMPLPLVLTIKVAHADLNDSQVADMYRTTSGKVSDIRKERNFGYINAETAAFTQDQIDAANARIEQLKADDQDIIKEAISDAGIKVGTEEELAAFDEARQGSRKPRGKAKEESADEEVVEAVESTEQAEDAPSEEDEDGLDDLLG